MKLLIKLLGLLMLSQNAIAQDQILEATVVSVDPIARVITVESNQKHKDYYVIKKAIVRVGDSQASLSDVKPGHKVKIKYDATLEVITAIAASGTPLATPQMVELSELPEAFMYSSPWIAPDGLSLYFYSRESAGSRPEIFVVTREATGELFGSPKKLVTGTDFSLTGDELEIVFSSEGAFYSGTRKLRTGNFSRPQKIPELSIKATIARPRLSEDGLSIFFDVHSAKESVEPYFSSRKARGTSWSAPQKVSLPESYRGKIRNLTLLSDGKTALAALIDQSSKQNSVVKLAMDGLGQFKSGTTIQLSDVPLYGTFPHYSAKANELYLIRQNEPNKKPAVSVFLYRNINID